MLFLQLLANIPRAILKLLFYLNESKVVFLGVKLHVLPSRLNLIINNLKLSAKFILRTHQLILYFKKTTKSLTSSSILKSGSL